MCRFARLGALFSVFLLLLTALPASGLVSQAAATAAVLPPPTTAPPATSAAAVALLEPTSGSLLVANNANERRPMASTTKIMTALVILSSCALDEVVTVPREAVGIEGSSIYLFEGEEITVRTLLYGLLLSSANDAAAALAIHAAGSIEAFADKMNEKACELGLTDTHFVNPHGLANDAHYTTARELALITAAAMKNAIFAEIVSTARYSVPQNGTGATRLFLNHNRLLRTYDGAIGVKTGFTKKSGRCLVSAAKRDGLVLIAVTLSDGNDWQDHRALLDWGFSEYSAFSPDAATYSLPVVGGTVPSAQILQGGSFSMILPKSHGEITCRAELPRFLFAGGERGARVGQLVWRLDGRVIGTVPLVLGEDIPRAPRNRGFFSKLFSVFIK